MENLKQLIESLYPMHAYLLGAGYDTRLEYLKHLINLDIIEVRSGTEFGTWTVPQEWICREAWIKKPNGEVLVDVKQEPLAIMTGSIPFQGKIKKEDLLNHLMATNDFGDNDKDSIPYRTSYYGKDWGFCVKKEAKESLEDGEYEVLIDSEFKDGIMKIGVHTIPGRIDKEILLFAHLDHPYQANDNLSAVACLVDLATRLKSDCTIKIIFCPETIGSIAYANLMDLSKVQFVIAVETCGKDGPIQLLKSFNPEAKINRVAHCALQLIGKSYKKGPFRANIGSDETVFNDPQIGIPGILISRWPYKEYHTNLDKPEIINYEAIKETGDLIQKIIEIWDKDYIPRKLFKGPLFRSKYDMQSPSKQLNLNYDYFFYSLDGKKSLAELCADFELPFDKMYENLRKIEEDGKIVRCTDFGEVSFKKTSRKKHS